MAGQTISDRFLAAKHSIAGQGLAKSVCKATTEELLGPKKKHLDYLVHCTNEPNVSIPQLANLLIERAQNTNWIVVFKALITVHHLLCYGNERFTQYLASSNSSFQLGNFLDKSGVQGAAKMGYDMSPFIRRYARYLNEKALSYRTIAFDFCKVKRGKEEGVLRTMNAEKLLKTLPVLQSQLDALLEFDCSAGDLSNAVITVAFRLLFRDLIRLFAGYNDSIINLLEKYFDMNKKQCRDALDLYKKFLIRMDRVGEFLKVAENVGIDKGEIPDLTKAPSSLLDALEQHLSMLEGKKAASKAPAQVAATQRTDVKTGVTALSSTSSSFGTAAAAQPSVMDETVTKQALEEEEAVMNQYKAKVQSPVSATNPFLNAAAPVVPEQPIVDLFSTPSTNVSPAKKASDDLLQLGNPFADLFTSTSNQVTNGAATSAGWTSNGFQSTTSMAGGFVDDQSFSSVFGETFQASSSNTTAANTGPITTPNILTDLSDAKSSAPPPPRPPPPISRTASPSPLISDDISSLQSTPTPAPLFSSPSRFAAGVTPPVATGKVLTGDLDSSLASLAENLTIDKGQQQTKGIQWNSPKNTAKPGGGTGGVMWTPQPMAATTGANYRPMVQGMQSNPPPMTTTFPSYGMMPPSAPVMRPQVPQGVVPVTQSNSSSLDPFGTF